MVPQLHLTIHILIVEGFFSNNISGGVREACEPRRLQWSVCQTIRTFNDMTCLVAICLCLIDQGRLCDCNAAGGINTISR